MNQALAHNTQCIGRRWAIGKHEVYVPMVYLFVVQQYRCAKKWHMLTFLINQISKMPRPAAVIRNNWADLIQTWVSLGSHYSPWSNHSQFLRIAIKYVHALFRPTDLKV